MSDRDSLFAFAPEIRKALGIGRATAIARAIENQTQAHTLGAEVAEAKEPFDAALDALERLRRLVEAHRKEFLDSYAEHQGDGEERAQKCLDDFEREVARV